jgi:Uma2 family endonuclease
MKTPIRLEQRAGPYTFEDFCREVREDQKADLINGVLYMASPENTEANELVGWLYTLIRVFARRRKLGKVYVSRVAFRLAKKHGPEPDIAFVKRENLHRVQRGQVVGPPDLALEVVSPDSVERDYYLKRELYEAHNIPEYWIVDEMDQAVTLLRLKQGKYREVRPRKGTLYSEVLTGFWLRPEWLWKEPLPDEIHTLETILGEKPKPG